MKTTLVLLILCSVAHGRIDETLEGCRKRYGQEKEIEDSHTIFVKNGIKIAILFRETKAISLVYLKADQTATELSDTEREILLKANSRGGPWAERPQTGRRRLFHTEDGKLFAAYDPGKGTLVISTMEEMLRVGKEIDARERKALEGF